MLDLEVGQVELSLAPREQSDARSRCGESDRQALSDPSARARDEHTRALQSMQGILPI